MLDDPVLVLLFAIFAGTATVYGLIFVKAEISVARSVVKTTPVVVLAAIAIYLGGPFLLFIALLACAAGDYLLSLNEEDFFIGGLIAFLLGHVFYTILFGMLIKWPIHVIVYLPLIGVILYAVLFAGLLWSKTGKLKIPVMIYLLVIGVMAAFAILLPIGQRLVTIGALVFVLSDSILAARKFLVVEDDPRVANMSVAVWWTYIVGQLAILMGVIVAS